MVQPPPAPAAEAKREWTLTAVAWLAALESTVLIAVIALGSYRAGPLLIALLALKYVFIWGLLRRRPGAWLALLLFEGTTAFAAVAKPGLPMYERTLEESASLGCIVLLAAAAALFPTPKIPPS